MQSESTKVHKGSNECIRVSMGSKQVVRCENGWLGVPASAVVGDEVAARENKVGWTIIIPLSFLLNTFHNVHMSRTN